MASPDDELERYRYRRGYWLRMARRRAGRLTLDAVAQLMGYSARSASSIKLWEDGKRDPSDVQLRRIAGVYNVPVEVFTDPDPTDEEHLDAKVTRLVAERARRGLANSA